LSISHQQLAASSRFSALLGGSPPAPPSRLLTKTITAVGCGRLSAWSPET